MNSFERFADAGWRWPSAGTTYNPPKTVGCRMRSEPSALPLLVKVINDSMVL
jgi:hypothetical protein